MSWMASDPSQPRDFDGSVNREGNFNGDSKDGFGKKEYQCFLGAVAVKSLEVAGRLVLLKRWTCATRRPTERVQEEVCDRPPQTSEQKRKRTSKNSDSELFEDR